MRKKLYQEIKNTIETISDCKLLTVEKDYIDTHGKIEILCGCKRNTFKTSYKLFMHGKKQCDKCTSEIQSEKTRKDGQIVYDLFIENNLIPQFRPDDYINAKIKMPYLCANNQEYGIQYITYDNLKQGRGCGCCRYKKSADKNRRNPKEVYDSFCKTGLIPQFDENFYINSSQLLPYICPNHPEEGVQIVTYSNFLARPTTTHCRKCAGEHIGNIKRLDGEIVLDAFYKKNYTPLFKKEDYKNNIQKLPYICNKHPEEGILETSYATIRDGIGCLKCVYENISGENHYYWKGGISPLCGYMRDKISQWKKDSLVSTNYCCDITGINSSKLVVHHLYGYYLILTETLEELILPIYKEINNYTDEQLKEIGIVLLEKHYKYGLGKPLLSIIHDLFHRIYSKRSTSEQYEEFKVRLKFGEFNEFLKENNLKLVI